IVLGLSAPAEAQPAAPNTTVYDFSTWAAAADTLRGVTVGQRVTLRAPFIEATSVRVAVDGVELARDAYQINPHLGTIRFVDEIAPTAVVVVSYRRRPFLLAPVYTLRPTDVSPAEPAPTTGGDRAREVVVRPETEPVSS